MIKTCVVDTPYGIKISGGRVINKGIPIPLNLKEIFSLFTRNKVKVYELLDDGEKILLTPQNYKYTFKVAKKEDTIEQKTEEVIKRDAPIKANKTNTEHKKKPTEDIHKKETILTEEEVTPIKEEIKVEEEVAEAVEAEVKEEITSVENEKVKEDKPAIDKHKANNNNKQKPKQTYKKK